MIRPPTSIIIIWYFECESFATSFREDRDYPKLQLSCKFNWCISLPVFPQWLKGSRHNSYIAATAAAAALYVTDSGSTAVG